MWLGCMTELRLLRAITRGYKTATRREIRAIESLIESSFEMNDPGEIEKAIEYAACRLGDHWEAQVDKEFIAALAVEASLRESDKNNGKPKKVKKNRSGYCGRK